MNDANEMIQQMQERLQGPNAIHAAETRVLASYVLPDGRCVQVQITVTTNREDFIGDD